MMSELNFNEIDYKLFSDNQSAIYLAKTSAFHSRMKHIHLFAWRLTIEISGDWGQQQSFWWIDKSWAFAHFGAFMLNVTIQTKMIEVKALDTINEKFWSLQ